MQKWKYLKLLFQRFLYVSKMTETEINTCNIIRDVIIDVLINYDGNTQERVQGGEL